MNLNKNIRKAFSKGDNMDKKNLENVISKQKLFFNLKKYWWIILMCVVLAVVGGTILSQNSVSEPENSQEVVEEQICAKNTIVDLKWESEIQSEVEYTIRRDDLEEVRGVITSYGFIAKLNKYLEKADYEVLKATDMIIIEIVSNNRLSFYILSYDDIERAEYILDKAVEMVLQNAVENYKVISYDVVQKSGSATARLINSRYYFYPVEEVDNSEENIDNAEKGNAGIDFVEIIILAILAAFIGALIILLVITLDKKVYSEDEIEKALDLEYLGVCNNKDVELNKLINVVSGKAKVQNVKEIRVVSQSEIENKVYAQFEDKLNVLGIDTKTVVDIMDNEKFYDAVDKTIILAVRTKVDTIDDVWNAYYCLKQAGGCITGFILV